MADGTADQRKLYQSIQKSLERLFGSTLVDVRVCTFRVELLFLGDTTTQITITKQFRFEFPDGQPRMFDPAAFPHDLNLESSAFAFLQGQQCKDVKLDLDAFSVSFADGSRCWVELTPTDFEPIQFMGMSGDRHEVLDFLWVL